MQNPQQFEKRKQDHIELALMPANQAESCNIFDSITLIHEAMPDINFEDITIASSRFGKPVPNPFLVSSMTAGHEKAAIINRHLMEACAARHWVMGVGSQRRELTDEAASQVWLPLRRDFPAISLFGNLGIAQIIDTPLASIQRLIDALEAQALIIHCNPLQECIQPEGTPQFKGGLQALENLAKNLPVPIIVKETGCGFSEKTLKRLQSTGVAAVDVSGLGGTHWGRIEGHRAVDNPQRFAAAQVFKNWGINTIHSVKNAKVLQNNIEIWGSGGVRHGLDAAKLCALGASTIGFAKPLLESALQSAEAVIDCMESIEYELKVAMFCTGSLVLSQLKSALCP